MRRISSLFSYLDLIPLGCIILISISAGRLPSFLEFEYPTALYSILTTIVQGIAPILAILIGILIYLYVKTGGYVGLTALPKGIVWLTFTFLLTIVLMPFAEQLNASHSARQAVVAGVTSLTLWSVASTVLGLLNAVRYDER